jgi:quinohemoprotein ethanol dehydrogenase
MLVFKLGGDVELAAPNRRDRSIPEQQVAQLEGTAIARGELHYNEYCAVCHGLVVRSGGAIADLRRMNEATHEVFNEIVIDGIYGSKGMAGFADVLTAPQAADIHQYVRARAHEDREVSLGNKKPELAQLTWQ